LPPGDVLSGLLFGSATLEFGKVHQLAPLKQNVALQPALSALDVIQEASERTATPFQKSRQSLSAKTPVLNELADPTTGITAPTDIAELRKASRSPVQSNTSGMNIGVSGAGASTGLVSLGRNAPMTQWVSPSRGNHVLATPGDRGSVDTSSARKRVRPPLVFESNEGQTDPRVDFIARASDYTAFVTPTGVVFSISDGTPIKSDSQQEAEPRNVGSRQGVAIHMDIVGAKPQDATTRESLPGKVNYLMGDDPSQWQTNVAHYGEVEYKSVYPGIDLVYYGKDQQLEYDFVVSPGADPNAIKLNFAGADSAEIDAAGNLILHNSVQNFVQKAPYLYQEVNGTRESVTGRYVLARNSSGDQSYDVSFAVGAYDPMLPLVIDPLALSYSTIFGKGNDDDIGLSFTMDGAGNYYSAGLTTSVFNFPVTPGAFDETYNGGGSDSFVFKISADGQQLVYSTYIGGSMGDMAYGLAVDALGSAYITAQVDSSDLPVTPGAFDETYNGGWDLYVAKLTPDGSALAYATYLGTPGDDLPADIQLDGSANAYLTGQTDSAEFPTTPGAYSTSHAGGVDAFVTKLSADGASLVYSTFVGGSAIDNCFQITIRNSEVYLVGTTTSSDFPITFGVYDLDFLGIEGEGFVAKLSADGSTLEFATFLGGSADDAVQAIELDGDGNLYVTGNTKSSDFPTTAGAFSQTYSEQYTDGFVAKLSPDGTSLSFGTYWGGNDVDFPRGIVPDSSGFVWVAGWSKSTDFPTTPDAIDLTHNGIRDITLAKFDAAGDIVYSTLFGGNRTDGSRGRLLVLSPNGDVNLGGWTDSSNYPTTPDALKRRNRSLVETYVTKFVQF
jgi:hypothetical protein